jgi:hypothetical protein
MVIQKPKLFKSFTGLTMQEFDDISQKEITKRYANTNTVFIKKKEYRE